ncbi:hypothetical protein [Terrabacter terrigena]|uniref:Uncharacterized protein n=1 Tax=Terrabacter terrigena TaxID=574718 RepID=A0ABW3MXQ9_9MICO
MSDFGFVDEARPDRARPARASPAGRPSPPPTRRVASPFAVAFVVVLVGLLGFIAWAWSGRLHTDDVAAWRAVAGEVEVLDRSLTPLGHSEIAPCRDSTDGRVTRTYPPSTGPQAAELVGFLTQKGWNQVAATPPAYARLTRTFVGHEVSVEVAARDGASLVDSLTASSPASAFGCLLH